MKHNNISTMQDQNQLAQAQQSILHVQNAIGQAQSHPNNEIMEQIKHSMDRAEQSLAQADKVTDNDGALELAHRELQQQKQAFQELTSRTLD